MQSQFSARTLAEIFRDLYLGERTGTLLLTRADEEKKVHFDRGMIVFAESPVIHESLGQFLVHEGKLSSGALAEAREHTEGEAAGTPEIARVLLQRELIGRSTLNLGVRAMNDAIIESVFRWEGGNGRFAEGAVPETVFETDILVTIDAILRGIFCMSGFEPIHEAMRGLDNRLRIRKPTPLPLEQLRLSPEHGFILSRLDGRSSLNDVISILPPGEEEVAARFLFGLLVLGLLEYEPALASGPFGVAAVLKDYEERQALESIQEDAIRQIYDQLRDQNPHQILGVRSSATHEEVESAYSALKEKFLRERLQPRVLAKYRSELTLIESRLIESYLTLTKPGQRTRPAEPKAAKNDLELRDLNVRVEMDRAESRLAMDAAHGKADSYFAKGRKFMREGDYHNAIQYVRLAITYNASDARYFFTLAECLARNPESRWQRMAEESYAKATQLDPWNVDYWMSLGHLYKRQGLKLRARKQFEEALKLVPNSPEVLRELRALRG